MDIMTTATRYAILAIAIYFVVSHLDYPVGWLLDMLTNLILYPILNKKEKAYGNHKYRKRQR